MSNLSIINSFDEMAKLAHAIAKSGLFGMNKPEEALSLMAIAHAEGYSPALAARDYHIIKGRPTLKADAMLSRFQQAGGKVKWNSYTDELVSGTFSHPQGGEITVDWDIDRAKRAGLMGNPTWQKYPRNMLRARVVSEAIRTVFPGVGTVGMYTPEEIDDMDDAPKAPTLPKLPVELPKQTTNKELLKKVMRQLQSEYEDILDQDLVIIGNHLMTLNLDDEDVPMIVRQEFDEKFKKKVVTPNAE